MSDPHIPTRPTVELRAVATDPPPAGCRVLALNHGGCLVPAVWTSVSHLDYDAWCEYPSVPRSVKDVQLSRFK